MDSNERKALYDELLSQFEPRTEQEKSHLEQVRKMLIKHEDRVEQSIADVVARLRQPELEGTFKETPAAKTGGSQRFIQDLGSQESSINRIAKLTQQRNRRA